MEYLHFKDSIYFYHSFNSSGHGAIIVWQIIMAKHRHDTGFNPRLAHIYSLVFKTVPAMVSR